MPVEACRACVRDRDGESVWSMADANGIDMNGKRRIAVVDDDLSVRKALQRLLRSVDLEADAYGSGQEFLDALDRGRPDCLVIDLQMPGMTGLELQQHLTRTGVHLPVVVITGHDQPGMRAQCIAAGVSTYLRKPLDDSVLLDAISRAISDTPRKDN